MMAPQWTYQITEFRDRRTHSTRHAFSAKGLQGNGHRRYTFACGT